MDSVHVAIMRPVRPGREAEFEQAVLEFMGRSMQIDGMLGVHLIKPLPGDASPTYGILRSFRDAATRDAFYASDTFAQWEAQVAPLVIGPGERRDLHGFEAFFRTPGKHQPPRWKMAVATWLGVFPTAQLWTHVLPPVLSPLPDLLKAALINMAMVATLAWVVMPWITRILNPWLRPAATFTNSRPDLDPEVSLHGTTHDPRPDSAQRPDHDAGSRAARSPGAGDS